MRPFIKKRPYRLGQQHPPSCSHDKILPASRIELVLIASPPSAGGVSSCSVPTMVCLPPAPIHPLIPPQVLISSKKYAWSAPSLISRSSCPDSPLSETCIKGHRSSTCKHTDRPLYEIKKKGRPVTQCEHCRELRKTKQVHVKCICEVKADNSLQPPSNGKKGTAHVVTLLSTVPIYSQAQKSPSVPPFQMACLKNLRRSSRRNLPRMGPHMVVCSSR